MERTTLAERTYRAVVNHEEQYSIWLAAPYLRPTFISDDVARSVVRFIEKGADEIELG